MWWLNVRMMFWMKKAAEEKCWKRQWQEKKVTRK